MFDKSLIKSFVLIVFFILVVNISAQGKDSQKDISKTILLKVQNTFSEGEISEISDYITNKTYIGISEEISGYFSYSQAYNLLSDYFKVHKPLNFRFVSMVNKTNSPFAWGEYKFMKNGIRGSHKIFVSLQKNESGYFISQITIN